MKLRWAFTGGALVVVAGGAYLVLRSPDQRAGDASSQQRSAQVALATKRNPNEPAMVGERQRMVMTESGLAPMKANKQPREWVDPQSGAVFREVVDAVPDPEAAAREELKYRKSRLKLSLADAAQGCYSGKDSHEEIELEYTLIVEKEVLRADNVRVKTSTVTDPTVERCMIDAIRDMRTFAPAIPDMREDDGIFVSLHDIHVRNAKDDRAARDDKDDAPQSFDRPAAKPPAKR